MTVERDVRVFFVGDSFVAGVGDPEHRGWVGRVAAATHGGGVSFTVYNLGVRGNTSSDVLTRWRSEVSVRRAPGCDERLVVSFGVNDTTVESGRPRVDGTTSVANLRALLAEAGDAGLAPFVVGPPPVDDVEQNHRIAVLSGRLAEACSEAGVPYVDVFDPLAGDEVWMREVRAGDGAHPGARGYQHLADLVLPRWQEWIGSQNPVGAAG